MTAELDRLAAGVTVEQFAAEHVAVPGGPAVPG